MTGARLKSPIPKFAADSKVIVKALKKADCEIAQKNLDRII